MGGSVPLWFGHHLSSLPEHTLSLVDTRHKFRQEIPPSREDSEARECVKEESKPSPSFLGGPYGLSIPRGPWEPGGERRSDSPHVLQHRPSRRQDELILGAVDEHGFHHGPVLWDDTEKPRDTAEGAPSLRLTSAAMRLREGDYDLIPFTYFILHYFLVPHLTR